MLFFSVIYLVWKKSTENRLDFVFLEFLYIKYNLHLNTFEFVHSLLLITKYNS